MSLIDTISTYKNLSVSAGFSYTKSSDVAQFSFSGNVLYQARRNQLALTYTNIVTNQDSGTSQQLLKNIYWNWTIYASGDNQPPASAASNSDYGVITSLGWTFGR